MLMYQPCFWIFTGFCLCSLPFQQPLSILPAVGFWPCLSALLKQTLIGICLAGSQLIFIAIYPSCLNHRMSWQLANTDRGSDMSHKIGRGIFSFRKKWKWNPILAHPLSKTINISWLPGLPNHLKQCSCYGTGSWTLSLEGPSVLLFHLESYKGG